LADQEETEATTAETDAAPPEKLESLAPLLERLRARLGEHLLATSDYRGDLCATIAREATTETFTWLRDEENFDMLADLTAVDYLGREPRFEMVYHLVSIETSSRIRIKIPLTQADAKVPTLCELWQGANWLEREAYDMYGIDFTGHPDLTRIYLYEEFEGHPLRKDYPKEKRQPLIGPGAIVRTGEGG
jgi:NADH-quinone oxidoreductase subunit C